MKKQFFFNFRGAFSASKILRRWFWCSFKRPFRVFSHLFLTEGPPQYQSYYILLFIFQLFNFLLCSIAKTILNYSPQYFFWIFRDQIFIFWILRSSSLLRVSSSYSIPDINWKLASFYQLVFWWKCPCEFSHNVISYKCPGQLLHRNLPIFGNVYCQW